MYESVNTSRFYYNPVSTNGLALHQGWSGPYMPLYLCEVRKYLAGRFLHSVCFIGRWPVVADCASMTYTHIKHVCSHMKSPMFMRSERIFSD
jgi:hypothetical protein